MTVSYAGIGTRFSAIEKLFNWDWRVHWGKWMNCLAFYAVFWGGKYLDCIPIASSTQILDPRLKRCLQTFILCFFSSRFQTPWFAHTCPSATSATLTSSTLPPSHDCLRPLTRRLDDTRTQTRNRNTLHPPLDQFHRQAQRNRWTQLSTIFTIFSNPWTSSERNSTGG